MRYLNSKIVAILIGNLYLLHFKISFAKTFLIFSYFSISFILMIPTSNAQNAKGLYSPKKNDTHRNVRALIIGVANYKNLPEENQLNYADDDATAFFNFLISRPDFIDKENIQLFINEEASKREYIEAALEDFIINESKQNDLVIVYFSGHASIQNPDALVDQGYLLLHNAPYDGDYAAPTSDVISINYLQELIANVNKGVKVLFIIDACHAGKLINQTANNEKVMIALQNKWEDTFKLTSCQSNQLSYEGEQWGDGHGVFTYHLLFGLNGIADIEGNNDGNLMLEEVYDYVKNKVKADTKYKQIPRFEGDGQVDLISVNREHQLIASKTLSKKVNNSLLKSNTKSISPLDSYFFGIPQEYKSDIKEFIHLVDVDSLIPLENLFLHPYMKINCNIPKIPERILVKHGADKIVMSDDMEHFAIQDDSSIYVYNISNYNLVIKINSTNIKNTTIVNNYIYLTKNNSLDVWSFNGKLIASKKFKGINILSSMSPSKGLIAVLDNSNLNILDPITFSTITSTKEFNSRNIKFMAFSSDSVLLFMDTVSTILNYSLKDNLIISDTKIDPNVSSIKILRNNRMLMLQYPHKIKLLDPDWFYDIWNSKFLEQEYESVYFTSFPHLLIFKSNNTAEVFDCLTNQIIHKLEFSIRIVDIVYKDSKIGIVLNNGNVHILDLQYSGEIEEVKYLKNAYTYYQKLITSRKTAHIRDRLKNYYYAALLNFSNKQLNQFVNNNNVTDYSKLDYAKECIKKAKIIMEHSTLSNEKIELTDELLNIFYDLSNYNYDNYSDILNRFRKLTSTYPDASYTYNTISSVYRRLNKLDKAQENSSVAIENNPYWSEPKINLARNKIKSAEYHEAIKILDSVVTQFPQSNTARILLGDIHLFLGDYNKSNYYYNSFDEKSNKNIYNLKKAHLLVLQRKYSSAIATLENIIDEDNKCSMAYLLLGKIYLYVYYRSLGEGNTNTNYFKSAASNIIRAKELNPSSPLVNLEYYNIVVMEIENVIKSPLKANRLKPLKGSVTKKRLEVLKYQSNLEIIENKEEILNDLYFRINHLLNKTPTYYKIYLLMATVQHMNGKEKEAIELFNKGIKENPSIADIYFFKGFYLYSIKELDKARMCFQRAINSNPKFLPAYYVYFLTYTKKDNGKIKELDKIKNKEFKETLIKAEKNFNTRIFDDSRSINYREILPYFFDQIYLL